MIGGETSPNLQSIVFESGYNPGSDRYKQDFMECVKTTHATYMLHSNAFRDGGYTGTELDNARFASARLGYNYIITKIGALSTSKSTIAVDVTIMQIGVAPFYFPLSLVLSCPGTNKAVYGLESVLSDTNDVKNYRFDQIPLDLNCLQNMKLQLASTFTYDERPIKFAQGNGTVFFSLPAPEVFSPTILTLIDAASETKIREITNNTIINLSAYQTINIMAEPPSSFQTGSVEFLVDGKLIRVENLPPYIAGNSVNPWRPSLGSHIVKITPYQGMNRGGSAGVPTVVTLLVVDQKPVPTKSPVLLAPPPIRIPVVPPTSSKLLLTLVDATMNTHISRMTTGMKIDLLKYPLLNILLDVDVSLSVNRIEFFYDGDLIRVEYNAPYSFYGNEGKDYFGWSPTVGDHFVEVRAFRDTSLVASVSITFYTTK